MKPGMTMEEVFCVLGIDLPKRSYAALGGGPMDDFRIVYQLAGSSNEKGYNLVVVNDHESKFKRAYIACWKQSNKCADDNEKVKNNRRGCPSESKGLK